MTTLLHISASPRGQRSESLAIAATFLDELRATQPDVAIEHWDLWDGTLPEFGPAAATAKMTVFAGADPEGEEATAWRLARDTFERFDSADYYLFGVPMWNASRKVRAIAREWDLSPRGEAEMCSSLDMALLLILRKMRAHAHSYVDAGARTRVARLP